MHARTHHHRQLVAADKPLVVIDPGHGGKDSGAIGHAGTLEKTVTLQTAADLKRLLLATGRYRVKLTRTKDRFVSLAQRVAFTRNNHAALFIAIHANWSHNRHAHGASVYTRSLATTKLQRIAADEANSARIGEAIARDKPDIHPGSALLQYTMIDNLNDDLKMRPDPARQARFYVLGLTDTPSVLLEIGFLSNRHDEAELRRAKHRHIIARAIRDAVNDYFDDLKHPTSHT